MSTLALACRLGAGSTPTLPRRVRSILRKYGATMLLPGPSGVLQYGFQPGNCNESTGNTLAAVDQQVGLVVDAAQSPGPELALNGGFDNSDVWQAMPAAGSAVVAGGVLTVTRTTAFIASAQPINFVAGKVYDINFSAKLVSGSAALIIALRIGGNTAGAVRLQHSVAGSSLMTGYSIKYFCANTETLWLQAGAGNAPGVVEFDSVSVRELPGIHASQATSGYQPYLRKVPKTLGPELVVNGSLDSADGWTLSGTATISGGVCDIATTGSGWLEQGVVTKAGSLHRVTATASLAATFCGAWDSAGRSALLSNSAGGRQPGFVEFFFTAADALSFIAFTSTASGATRLDNISVREVLEWTYAWQFDGVDDRLVGTAVPFQPSDDYFSVFGVVRNSDAVLRRIWEVQNVGIGGGMGVWLTNNTATFYASGATAVTVGVADGPVVITAKKLGNARSIQADNLAPTTSTTSVTDHTSLTCVIGNTFAGDRPYSGPIYGGIIGKGAISDAELQTLKRFIARLQGRSL